MKNIRNLTLVEMEELAGSMDMPASRGRQLFGQVFSPGMGSFSQLHNISQEFIRKISAEYFIEPLRLHKREKSADGTVKYAFIFADDSIIESVLIPANGRHTLCISTQAGCAMGCRFCLTSTMGFRRNLETAEIIGQVLYVMTELKAGNSGIINNIVFMGMGEPLDNSGNCIKALSIMQAEKGLNFPDRKITISTCGITPEIIKFAEISNVNLALSLHSVDEKVRTELMPINRKYPLKDLLDLCRKISAEKESPILIEYILFRDINDSEEDAHRLAEALHDINCKINLLTYNENPNLRFRRSSEEASLKFKDILHHAGYRVMMRRSRGSDISAACGQLAGTNSL
jgi:23S rRNA (adenine2503-C2)-methyltransferase